MQFRVKAATSPDLTTPPLDLVLPPLEILGPAGMTRDVSLNEEESESIRISEDDSGNIVLDCDIEPDGEEGEVAGPIAALLGTLNPDESGNPLRWGDAITENPALGAIEEWRVHNFTEDAHPIHIHLVKFKVLGRGPDGTQPPADWETGFKDTVIAYPEEITRIKAKYDLPGFYVWHCHIVEHEDNEMMRPFHVGPIPPDAPAE